MFTDTVTLQQTNEETLKLLIIEPEPIVTDLLFNYPNNMVEQVGHAESGMVGVELTQSTQPDLIICDIDVQQPNGFEVLRILQSNPKTRTVPVVMIGQDDCKQTYRKAILGGAEDYLSKPFDSAEVYETIQTHISKRRLLKNEHEETLSALRKNITFALPHEFRTPLMVILGYADMLASDDQLLDTKFVHGAAKSILSSGLRLQRLTENYLVYIQLEAIASDQHEIKKFNRHLIGESKDIIEVAALDTTDRNDRTDDISFDLVSSPMRISQENLSKIVQELVDNACKFSKPGDEIVVKSRRKDNSFQLYIADNGRGMSEQQIEAMGGYMQFGRAEYEQQGIGMGFIVAKRLAELHRGKLSIRSEVNQGTIIGIRFPL